MSFTRSILLAAVATALASTALAQAQPAAATGTTGPTFIAGPPAGFDPLAASDAELVRYGFPRRPDQSEPALYSLWLRMVTAPQTRLTNLTVQTTNIINGRTWDRRDLGLIGNAAQIGSDIWSGWGLNVPSGTFQLNQSVVLGDWYVPNIGSENCTYGPYYVSQWVGFDGDGNSNDVLQAGIGQTACGQSTVAWYEWYTNGCTGNEPACYQTNISLPVQPGNRVYVAVSYWTAAPHGQAYIVNQTTQQSVVVQFNQPSGNSGSSYVGDSVEWVVERPEVGGIGLPDLANYNSFQMECAATNWVNNYQPSSSPAGTLNYQITMQCPPWNPSSACRGTQNLSSAQLSGANYLSFSDSGPAASQ